jgi:hypothetical protein
LLSSVASAHEGHFRSIAWDACATSTLGQTCSFDDGVNVSRGTCRSMSDALVCVRSRPLEQKRRPVGLGVGLAVALAAGAFAFRFKRRHLLDSSSTPRS